ncbi:MAG: hypothetical protein JXA49_01595 [Actinobacteria bacterium]|nr:hypothetical protein [Actinomycetota bacterium]
MFSRMVYGFLFYCVALFLKLFLGVASLRSSSFKEALKEKEFTMLVKTRDGKKSRYYRLEGGKFKSRGSDYPGPDLSITWFDSPTFLQVISKLNVFAMIDNFTEAMTTGNLEIEADLGPTAWFVLELKEMLGVYRHFFSLPKTAKAN